MALFKAHFALGEDLGDTGVIDPTYSRLWPARPGQERLRDTGALMVTDTTVEIARPVTEVFSFYRDFRNLPLFLGDVMSVDVIDRTTSRWTIRGPFGLRTRSVIRVTSERANSLLRYQTVAPPPFRCRWEVAFTGSTAKTTRMLRASMFRSESSVTVRWPRLENSRLLTIVKPLLSESAT